MFSFLKKILPNNFKQNVKDNLGVPSLSLLLKHLSGIGYKPNRVIDCGAYEGNWAKEFERQFPHTPILMIEAQESKRPKLESLTVAFKNMRFDMAVLSCETGKHVSFAAHETASHIINKIAGPNDKTLTTQTLHQVVKQKGFVGADFLKLDVRGHELEVLKGGLQTLSAAEFCLLELTVLDIGDDSPLMLAVLNFMDEQGFQMYDMGQFMRRPFDKALHQLDGLFVKKSSRFIADKRW